jgi:uncharacterized protein (TIGR04255 family)
MARPADLPDFEKPPLVEVVLSVQFSDLRGYRSVHHGLLWDRKFRDSFPQFAEHAPLDPVFETFGPRSAERPRFRLEQMPGPPVPRLWLMNIDKSHLIQVQVNRFLHNWRRIETGAGYPRYEILKDRFFQELDVFSQFVEAETLGNIEYNQCEVTYVNIITLPGGQDVRIQPERVFRSFAHIEAGKSSQGAGLPRLENVQFVWRYIFEDATGEPAGRLFISCQPGLGADQTPLLRLDLTARGAPASTSLEGVADFLDLGRDVIVRAFTAITTSEMHQIWKRRR